MYGIDHIGEKCRLLSLKKFQTPVCVCICVHVCVCVCVHVCVCVCECVCVCVCVLYQIVYGIYRIGSKYSLLSLKKNSNAICLSGTSRR